jgi:cytochrome o ubiquinol oxidase operon protein cyoD
MSGQKEQHPGTISSYVYGLLLSLLFTAIPYELVVNKTVTGTALLATILVFAVLQMLVQIFFFLHLGRGPKPLYNVVFFGATVFAILVVTVGSVFIMSNLHSRMVPSDELLKLSQDENIAQVSGAATGACQGNHANHQVTITNGTVSELQITARRCDTLTLIDDDASPRTIVFGSSPNHETYGGKTEMSITKHTPETITLNQSGTFMFRDDKDPGVYGYFTVAP